MRVISMTFDSALGGFNDSELREFLKDKEVISIEDHFFIKNEVPFLTMVVKYFPFRQETDPALVPQGKRDEAWREMITDADMGTFNLLREWRSKRSREEGVPPYIVFTNKQLAQLIKENPSTVSHLERVDGVGKSRVEKYGKEVLEILNSKPNPPTLPLNGDGDKKDA